MPRTPHAPAPTTSLCRSCMQPPTPTVVSLAMSRRHAASERRRRCLCLHLDDPSYLQALQLVRTGVAHTRRVTARAALLPHEARVAQLTAPGSGAVSCMASLACMPRDLPPPRCPAHRLCDMIPLPPGKGHGQLVMPGELIHRTPVNYWPSITLGRLQIPRKMIGTYPGTSHPCKLNWAGPTECTCKRVDWPRFREPVSAYLDAC